MYTTTQDEYSEDLRHHSVCANYSIDEKAPEPVSCLPDFQIPPPLQEAALSLPRVPRGSLTLQMAFNYRLRKSRIPARLHNTCEIPVVSR